MKKSFALVLSISSFFGHFNAVFSQSVSTPARIVTKLSDRVYVIRHRDAPDGNAQGNTSIIIGDNKVIVVDACYLPSAAREDIETIKKLTGKPVDYLVNTHWHADHQQGNPEYVRAFPHITIIAHEETAKDIIAFEKKDLERYRQSQDTLKDQIAKADTSKAPPTEELKEMKELSAGQDSVEKEFGWHRAVEGHRVYAGSLGLSGEGADVARRIPGS